LELGLRVSLDPEGRTIWIADAHRGDGKRFVVDGDEKLNCVSGTRIGDSRSRRFHLTSREIFSKLGVAKRI
jgi:hypothetical protein